MNNTPAAASAPSKARIQVHFAHLRPLAAVATIPYPAEQGVFARVTVKGVTYTVITPLVGGWISVREEITGRDLRACARRRLIEEAVRAAL